MFPKIYLLKKETERDKIERNRDRINYEKYKNVFDKKNIYIDHCFPSSIFISSV